MLVPTCRTLATWWLLCLLLVLVDYSCAQRRDVVVMKNGDRITGQVKKLEHGQLFIETPYVETPIPVDWLQVQRVESDARYQLEMSDGRRLAGTIEKIATGENPNRDFRIEDAGMETRLPAADVVAIESQKSSVWKQMKGSVDFGFSYASGSADTAVNLDAATSYRSTEFQIGTSLNSSFSGRTESGSTNRQDLSTTSAVYLSRHAFVGNLMDFLSSNQQSIDLRQTYGGGYGRYFIRTNNTQLSWLGGVVYVKERYNSHSGLNPKDQNAEGLLQLDYDWFRFNTSELQASLQLYPGLSDTGRVRTNLNTSYSVNLTHDLAFRFDLWDTFDTRPPVTARRNELGVSTGFGVKF
jgi:putative salt-induced outer membrane protein YdiY